MKSILIMFSLTNYIQNIIISTCNQLDIINDGLFGRRIKYLKFCVYFISIAHFIFQMVKSHMWLLATKLDNTDLEPEDCGCLRYHQRICKMKTEDQMSFTMPLTITLMMSSRFRSELWENLRLAFFNKDEIKSLSFHRMGP